MGNQREGKGREGGRREKGTWGVHIHRMRRRRRRK
jgi:hypothetical protein